MHKYHCIMKLFKNHKDAIPDTHKSMYYSLCNLFVSHPDMRRNEDDTHFTICPWSKEDATEGPDTCVCVNTSFKIEKILRAFPKNENNPLWFSYELDALKRNECTNDCLLSLTID